VRVLVDRTEAIARAKAKIIANANAVDMKELREANVTE